MYVVWSCYATATAARVGKLFLDSIIFFSDFFRLTKHTSHSNFISFFYSHFIFFLIIFKPFILYIQCCRILNSIQLNSTHPNHHHFSSSWEYFLNIYIYIFYFVSLSLPFSFHSNENHLNIIVIFSSLQPTKSSTSISLLPPSLVFSFILILPDLFLSETHSILSTSISSHLQAYKKRKREKSHSMELLFSS
jgi:hypothetical protein